MRFEEKLDKIESETSCFTCR